MTALQAYLLLAPLVLVALAAAAVWWTGRYPHRLHPGE